MNPNIIKLVSGSNAKLDEASTQATVKISCSSSPAILDISCFMVGGNGKVPSDDFFIFYNQPADPKHTVVFNPIDKYSGEFAIDLRALSASGIDKCVFAATLDGPGTFADVRGCRISAAGKGTELVYEIMDGNAETSLVLAELYRHGGASSFARLDGAFMADLSRWRKRTGSRWKTKRRSTAAEQRLNRCQAIRKQRLHTADLLRKQSRRRLPGLP